MGAPEVSLLSGSSVVVVCSSMGLPSWASEPAASTKGLACVALLAICSMALSLGPPRELGAERDQMSISPGDHGQLVSVVRH